MKFAEIELETGPDRGTAGEAALRFFSAVPQPQPIEPRVIDPIRQKFYDMRSLASKRPFARNDSELFFRQAKFMEDFTDNHEGDAKFNMYFPYYQHMGYEYLRTYFTWRTRVRQGDIRPTSLSYIFLYIYEMLSGIGVEDPVEGLRKLIDIWNIFSPDHTALEAHMPKWFKDYHIFYELPHSFSDFVDEHGLQGYYSLTLLFDDSVENKLKLWNSISSYNVTNSRFYKEGNEQLLSDCFNAVLTGINEFCEKRNTRVEDLLIYSVSRRMPWQPFKQALFYDRQRQTDREIIISAHEKYYCRNGEWTANLPIYYSSQKDFVGYVIKKTESCLRQEVKYKYKLAADLKTGSKPFRELQRPAAKRAELDKVIEIKVAEFYRELNRTVVTVDFTNLARIREEALGTQEQLIVPEADILIDIGVPKKLLIPDMDALIESTEATQQAAAEETKQTLSFSDGWVALKNALTDIERKALTIILRGEESIKSFADENNIMLEVLADSINEKAADYIGDSLLEVEDELYIYDEYRENIAGMVGVV